ncbi:MAG: adenosylmethionine--8-amino-7-oxononanoate transaminase [Elusimicrobia bacterium]|nr:adenosylmethionine--8-amino-7-oxononanoate transaminase [Elusimicrobiota bacterium]
MNNWLKKDLKYIWHPYTQMKDCESTPPILIERAKGMKLYDNKGNIFFDTISSWWCNVHGHNHHKIKSAIKKQLNSLDHIMFAGFTHKPAILLAEKLISITPRCLNKIFFSDNGSTAVETALKISFQYWQNIRKYEKKKFISLDYGYHGDTIGAMSVSGVDLFNEIFSSLFFSSFKVPSPYCYRCPVGKKRDACEIDCIQPLEELLREKKQEIAAIVIEPLLLAAGGMIVYPKEYLEKVAILAKKHDVHLIIDEIATGFGRTGKMFAIEYVNIQPDFLCLSKGITSGTLPLAVTLTTDEVYNTFYDDYNKKKMFYHGHTYTANPLSCAAALASLEIFEEEKTIDKIKNLIPVFHKGMEKFRSLPSIGDVRYIGMVGAIELVKDKKTKIPFTFEERIGMKVYKEGLKNGLILRPLGNIIYLYLPLCIKKNEMSAVIEKTFNIIVHLNYLKN